MRPDVARVIVTLSLIPLLPGLFYVYLIAEQQIYGFTGLSGLFRAYELCILLTIIACVLAWRKYVVWTRPRVLGTLVGSLAFILSPVVLFAEDWITTGGTGYEFWAMLRGVTPLLAGAAWIAAMARLWRSDSDSSLSSLLVKKQDFEIRCPRCDYSLTGLREIRCPECGWETTVDGLVRSLLNAS